MGLVLAFALAWDFVPLQYTIWDGGFFDLKVHLVSQAGPIRSVHCSAYRQRQEAELASENPLQAEAYATANADPFVGEALILNLPLSGRTSPMGRELSFHQCRHLLVRVNLVNGRQISKIVEIDSRLSREITVSLP